MKNIIFGILLHVIQKMVSIINNSVSMCDKVIEETRTIPTKFNEKR